MRRSPQLARICMNRRRRSPKQCNQQGKQCRPPATIRASRGVAQPGSASGLGPEGRRFESFRPDHEQRVCCYFLYSDCLPGFGSITRNCLFGLTSRLRFSLLSGAGCSLRSGFSVECPPPIWASPLPLLSSEVFSRCRTGRAVAPGLSALRTIFPADVEPGDLPIAARVLRERRRLRGLG